MNNTELIRQQLELNPTEVYIVALQDAQANLWSDLNIELGMAANGYWSIGAQNKIERIVRIAKVVGPTTWGHVQYPLLVNNIYQTILEHYGLEVPTDMDYQEDLYIVSLWEKTIPKIKELDPEGYL